ncbi:NADP-dependent oxidoreductase [Nocardioides sp. KIGAM211]|uniref:NADP-dependent oxidoreductase n=1 Tax=Nocardioides luti TaxID=2761101 RepID=A0A7X0REE4_9ACTN|nr:NADP-dependent oxidoreductase [Nocardioides luti]MBB6625775.1 NADP-dependent oxidoreductase [Nocardioides luti]
MTTSTREVHLASRPSGWPTAENFRLVDVELPDPEPGQVLVRNTVMSVDPYMRGRMNDVKSYVPPFQLGEPMDGGAVGEVVALGDGAEASLAVGDTVLHQAGWRAHALLPVAAVRKVDVAQVPASAHLGVLGMPGLTAYAGLTRVAGLQEDDAVLVSGAAGAVGSVAGQLAKLLGASKVVGTAGSAEKVAWLTDELGFDAAVNYKDGPVGKLLTPHAPFDVYFDNVGGDHLEAAMFHLNDNGRIAACGAIAQYNDEQPTPGPRNMMMIVSKRLTLRGFIVTDHADLAGEFYRRAGAWVAEGRLTSRETVVDGLDHAVDAFLDLMRGANTGKMLVRL